MIEGAGRGATRFSWFLAAAIVLAFVAFALHVGVPVLRHDWSMPSDADGWRAFGLSLASGWDGDGIGSARPYPTLYVLGPTMALIGTAFGSVAALFALLAAIGISIVAGCLSIGITVARDRWVGLALGASLLFDPWTYEKLVAGHLTMLLSVGMCAILAGELLRARPRAWIIVVCVYVAAFQIQFGFLSVALVTILRFERRTIALALGASILSLLPAIVGIGFSHSTLFGIPFTVEWQYANSLPPLDAVLLDGYSQRYTAAAYPAFQYSSALLVATALIGLWCGLRERSGRGRSIGILVVAAFVLCYASGLRGSFASLYTLSLNLRQTLVFRELYDLIGVVAVLYVILAAMAASRYAWARLPVVAAAAIAIGAWCWSPPSHWWIPARSVPAIRIDTSRENSRFALMPWRQPLMFEGAGSGADPDAYARRNGVTPINEYDTAFPGKVALAEYEATGDPRDLEALSVSRIYWRPYFSTDAESVRRALPLAEGPVGAAGTTSTLHPEPELSIVALPPTSDVPMNIRDLYLFDGGDPDRVAADISTVQPPLSTSDPRYDWIALGLVDARYPDIANPFGGAFTQNHNAMITVPVWRPSRVLARISGSLRSDRGMLSGSTPGWRWVDVGLAKWLKCEGRCALVAWERHPIKPRSQVAVASGGTPVAFAQLLPFLIQGDLPATHGTRLLLYRARFDSAWVLVGDTNARHVAVSGIFNGFVLPPGPGGRFYLIERTAVAQAVTMVASVVGLVLVLWGLIGSKGRSPVGDTADYERYATEHPGLHLSLKYPAMYHRSMDGLRGTWIEVGAGDGIKLAHSIECGDLERFTTIAAYDISEQRVARIRELLPGIESAVGDAENLPVPDGSVDYYFSDQVIEHVGDDRAMARDILRVLRPGGRALIGSTIKGKGAWYFYRCNGKWAIDPTHLREYPSIESYRDVFEGVGLRVVETAVEPTAYSIGDLVLRAGLLAVKRGSTPRWLSRMAERLASRHIRIPRYYLCYALLERP